MAIIPIHECCEEHAILYVMFEIIYCGACGSQLHCDGVCGGCGFQLVCLAMPRLPFERWF